VPLSDMLARAKPDLANGSEQVTIRSFKLTRTARRLDAAPVVEDVSLLGDAWLALDDAWLAKLDSGVLDESHAPAAGDARPATPEAGEAGPGTPEAGDARPATPEAGDARPATPEAGEAGPGTPEAGDARPATPEAGDARPATPQAGEARPATPEAGEAPPATPEAVPMPRLGALTGQPALDPEGRPIGTIADVVLDVPKARVAYLMVLLRPAAESAEPFRAVPFEALGPRDENGVRLTIDARALAKSPAFREQDLPLDPFASPAGATAQEPR
jgi:hypothetical protein